MAPHQPVLLAEALQGLGVRPDGRYLDCTFGRGGHARAILARLGPQGRLYALDRDPEAFAAARELQAADARVVAAQAPFSALASFVRAWGVAGGLDGVLMDLGVSSPQLDDPRRGFGFRQDGPLDMRMDPDSGESAAAWIARVGLDELVRVLRDYGEEPHAGRIARAIVRERAHAPIATTGRLAAIVAGAVPGRCRHHPATRTFQAIRIQVNRELEELESGLEQALEVLSPGGRLVVISFHSIEDRIVKRFLRRHAQGEAPPRRLPVTGATTAGRLRIIGGLVRPSARECQHNPRARSARLRVAERRR